MGLSLGNEKRSIQRNDLLVHEIYVRFSVFKDVEDGESGALNK